MSVQMSLRNWHLAITLPLDVYQAALVLVGHGYNPDKVLKLLVRLKRGRRPTHKPKSSAAKNRGRPKRWCEADYRYLWRKYEEGGQLLRKRGQRVTYFAALEAVCLKEGMQPRPARALALKFYKRLSEAKKSVRKIDGK